MIDTYNDGEASVTGIYLDDNQDGVADRAVPVYSGDLSEYTVNGIKDADIRKPIRITVKNGTMKTIYGAYNAEIAVSKQDAVIIDVQGGYIETVEPLVNCKTDGYVRLEYAENMVGLISDGTYDEWTGYYKNHAGSINIYGNYIVKNEINATSLAVRSVSETEVIFEKPVTITGNYSMSYGPTVTFKDTVSIGGAFTTNQKAEITFEETVDVKGKVVLYANNNVRFKAPVTIGATLSMGNYTNVILEADTVCDIVNTSYASVLDITETAKLTTRNLSVYSMAKIYHRGIFAATGSVTNSGGYWCVIGGTFAEGTDAGSIPLKYYPVSCTTELANTQVTPSSGMVKVENVYYMSPDSSSSEVKYTVVPGYDSYLSINGSDSELMGASPYAFTMVDEPADMVVTYVPKNIHLTKRYADPVLVAGTEYTDKNPVYNLKTLAISDDTTSSYGGDVLYAVKNGSSLPEGLQLTDGKIIGTPNAANGDGETVTFVVTGRNGTTASIELNICIKNEAETAEDINEVASVSGSRIYLNGASVVILPDAENEAKSGIYMDADHDGIADNNQALQINGQSSYELKDYDIYGYNDTTKAYDGDISIYVWGGK